jgi:hypothetical protein
MNSVEKAAAREARELAEALKDVEDDIRWTEEYHKSLQEEIEKDSIAEAVAEAEEVAAAIQFVQAFEEQSAGN